MSFPENSDYVFGRCYHEMSLMGDSPWQATSRCNMLTKFLDNDWKVAQITSQEQQDYIVEYMKSKSIDSVWLGMDSYYSGDWFYMENPVTYFNWADGQPPETIDRHSGAYVTVEAGKWYKINFTALGTNRTVICVVDSSNGPLGNAGGGGNNPTQDPLSSGAIAGIVIGCMVVVALVVGGVVWKKSKKTPTNSGGEPDGSFSNIAQA